MDVTVSPSSKRGSFMACSFPSTPPIPATGSTSARVECHHLHADTSGVTKLFAMPVVYTISQLAEEAVYQ